MTMFVLGAVLGAAVAGAVCYRAGVRKPRALAPRDFGIGAEEFRPLARGAALAGDMRNYSRIS